MSAVLLDAQARFQRHVLGSDDASGLIAGDAGHVAQRLGIYVNAYRMRLLDTLADTYEKTRLYLGAERFEAEALGWIEAHAPTTRSLRWYGSDFPAALAGAAAELARLDHALRDAFDGPDADPLGPEALAALPPEAWADLGLILHPTARCLEFRHNSVALWQAYDDETEPPELLRGEVGVTWLVWRKGHQPHFRSLHPAEAALLAGLARGEPFGTACESAEAAADGHPDFGAWIGGWLRQWVEDGLLVGLRRG